MHPPTTTLPIHQPQNFDEAQWLKLLFLISDTQGWLNELQKEAFSLVPLPEKKKLFRKTFYLTATALAHIVEKHYYKVQRYPHAGKFTIPVIELLAYLREAFHQPVFLIKGSLNGQRVLEAATSIGFDQSGQSTPLLTVITDPGGRIITAFPGIIKTEPTQPSKD